MGRLQNGKLFRLPRIVKSGVVVESNSKAFGAGFERLVPRQLVFVCVVVRGFPCLPPLKD
jgi:hypothetical protein